MKKTSQNTLYELTNMGFITPIRMMSENELQLLRINVHGQKPTNASETKIVISHRR